MKKILFKKILFDCLKFFLIALLGISAIVWVFQAVNYLDIMVEDGRNYFVYLNYTFLSFPKIIGKIFPFALFLGFYYIISKYEANNELVIFWTHGVKKNSLVNFFLSFSLILTIIQISITSIVIPKTQDLARSTLRNSNINFIDNFVKPKKFNDIIKGITIYSEKKEDNGLLKNIYIKKITSKDEFEITYAKEGEIKSIGNTKVLVLYNGENIKGNKKKLDSFSFSKSDFNLTNIESNTITHPKVQEISSANLLICYQSLNKKNFSLIKKLNITNCSKKNLSNIFSELYKRFIIPLYIPIIILVSLFLITTSKENPRYSLQKILIFLIGFFIIIFSEITIRFVENTMIDNIKILILPFLIGSISYQFFNKKFKIN